MQSNSVVEFHKLSIKRNILTLVLLAVATAISVFILKMSIQHIKDIQAGVLVSEYNLSAVFYTLIMIIAAVLLGLLAYIVVLVLFIIRSIKMINHYKKATITNIQRIQLPFDYKLWQTAPKNTFHAMPLILVINGEEKSFLSDIIFTNNTKIGPFKIPSILCSHSYVKDFCTIGFDEERQMAVVLSVEKQ